MFGCAAREALRERLGIEAPHSSLRPPVAHFNRITSARGGRSVGSAPESCREPSIGPECGAPRRPLCRQSGSGGRCGLPDPQWSGARSRSVGPGHCRLCHVVRSEACIDLLSAYRARATEPGATPWRERRSSAHRVAGEDLEDRADQVARRRVATRRTNAVLARTDQEGRQACLAVAAGRRVRGHEP